MQDSVMEVIEMLERYVRPGVNFTNILRAAFCTNCTFVLFLRKNSGAKAAFKMLVKMTPFKILKTNKLLACKGQSE